MAEPFKTVSSHTLRLHVLTSFQRYWLEGEEKVWALPVPKIEFSSGCSLPHYTLVELPDWAQSCGVDRNLLVPVAACVHPEMPFWQEVDWWLAAFLMLECWPERNIESHQGPIHSYSLRLKGWDSRVWDRAWVNRIALFLRIWAAREADIPPDVLFGPVPAPEIFLTHDVDAVAKTMPIRLKQSAFNIVNAARQILKFDLGGAFGRISVAIRFLLGSEDWWRFDQLLEMERRFGIAAKFNFYADCRKKNLKRWLLDPGYDLSDQKIRRLIARIKASKGAIGLHPTFDSWDSKDRIREQKKRLTQIAGVPILSCRQHWLRFSWCKTWSAQERAGLELDSTLMFNDRPGFRAASAIVWRPWNLSGAMPHSIKAIPTVLMDSQLYDYDCLDADKRKKKIKYWLDEIRMVGGQADVLWHPHTLTRDYGWIEGFKQLIEIMNYKESCPIS